MALDEEKWIYDRQYFRTTTGSGMAVTCCIHLSYQMVPYWSTEMFLSTPTAMADTVYVFK